MHPTLRAAAFVVAGLLAAPTALACSCLPPTVQSSWNNADAVFSGRVLGETRRGQWVVYDVRVTRDGKSCMAPGTTVQIATAASSAACGTRFQVGSHMLFFASATTISGRRALVTNSCAGNLPVSALTADDVDWLRARYVPCSDQCVDPSVPVFNCLIDPCTLAPPCPTGTCEPNYCGGCVAEFYDGNGYQVCNP